MNDDHMGQKKRCFQHLAIRGLMSDIGSDFSHNDHASICAQ